MIPGSFGWKNTAYTTLIEGQSPAAYRRSAILITTSCHGSANQTAVIGGMIMKLGTLLLVLLVLRPPQSKRIGPRIEPLATVNITPWHYGQDSGVPRSVTESTHGRAILSESRWRYFRHRAMTDESFFKQKNPSKNCLWKFCNFNSKQKNPKQNAVLVLRTRRKRRLRFLIRYFWVSPFGGCFLSVTLTKFNSKEKIIT